MKITGHDIKNKRLMKAQNYNWYRIHSMGKYGAEDEKGNLLIPVKYDEVEYSNVENGFKVKSANHVGFYDKKGQCLVQTNREYNNLRHSWQDDYFFFTKDGYMGLCDKLGKQKILFKGNYDLILSSVVVADNLFLIKAETSGFTSFDIFNGEGKKVLSGIDTFDENTLEYVKDGTKMKLDRKFFSINPLSK